MEAPSASGPDFKYLQILQGASMKNARGRPGVEMQCGAAQSEYRAIFNNGRRNEDQQFTFPGFIRPATE